LSLLNKLKAACNFTACIFSGYRLSTGKLTLPELKELPGTDRLLQHKQRL